MRGNIIVLDVPLKEILHPFPAGNVHEKNAISNVEKEASNQSKIRRYICTSSMYVPVRGHVI